MSRLPRALLAAVLLAAVLGTPVLSLLPPDPTARAPFVPVVVVVAGFLSYVFVYRDGPTERRSVTGSGPKPDEDRQRDRARR
jgi:hypothetical protein